MSCHPTQPWWKRVGWETSPAPLWLVERRDGFLFLLGGAGLDRARQVLDHLRASDRCSGEGGSVRVAVRAMSPARYFEARIASRGYGNRPCAGFVTTPDRSLRWSSSTHRRFRLSEVGRDEPFLPEPDPARSVADVAAGGRTRLWGLPTVDGGLILFTARTFRVARKRAFRQYRHLAPALEVEPVERIEFEFAPADGPYRVARYALGIFAHTVVWPATWDEDLVPGPSLPPDPPPAVEVRMPIPHYTRIDAVGRASLRRRNFDLTGHDTAS